MSIVCGCGRRVETQPEWSGQWITCPGCAGSLYAPYPGPKPSIPTVPDAPSVASTRLCPLCAETIAADDPGCRYCGGTRPAAAPRPAPAQAVGDGGLGALIVSLAGYVFCGLLCPIGWYLGSRHEAECRRLGVDVPGAAKAGKIIGILGTLFLLLSVVFLILCAAGGA